MRDVADIRIHGTTGERPIDRFEREERAALQSLVSRPSFERRRSLLRRVQSDCCVEVDTNHYSVPYVHLGRDVVVDVVGGRIEIRLAGELLAEHTEVQGSRQWSVQPRHLEGIVRANPEPPLEEQLALPISGPELLRPLSVYEDAIGGAL